MTAFRIKAFAIFAALTVAACGSTPPPPDHMQTGLNYTPIPKGALALPDRTAFLQKDPRWSDDRLGQTSDTMGTDGCLVTATAMALGNLGFETDPADLNARLTATNSYTPKGWLIWSGIDKVTNGRAEARFHEQVSEDIINSCMIDGYYPLVQFYLPNGRSHWAMIVEKTNRGYMMRDPLKDYKKPLLFPRSSEAFKAVRCVGAAG